MQPVSSCQGSVFTPVPASGNPKKKQLVLTDPQMLNGADEVFYQGTIVWSGGSRTDVKMYHLIAAVTQLERSILGQMEKLSAKVDQLDQRVTKIEERISN